jgi:diguanylate cyclase (GGDEF)-like protein
VDLQSVIERRRAEVLDVQSRRAQTVALLLAATIGVGLAVVAGAAWWVRGSLLARYRAMSTTARRIVEGADERMDTSIHDTLGGVAAAFNAGLDKQADLVTRLGTENRRASVGRQIADGLDLATDSPAVYEVVRRAMLAVAPHAAAELIITDAGEPFELNSVTATPEPCCPVVDPNECAAMRRGATQRFTDPHSINACPNLAGRDIGWATCIPATFLGQPLGVLHVVAAAESEDRPDETMLSELATLAANRIGTMRAFAQEEQHASTDPLTGLLNRRSFERAAHHVTLGVLAMSDLDHFKLINDLHGHQAGDQALTLFADVLNRGTRSENDLVARWGGEEFAILLPGTDMTTATEIIGRIQELLARECITQAPAFTSSWGLAPMNGSLRGAISQADAALYQAKSDGRNRYVIANSVATSSSGSAT